MKMTTLLIDFDVADVCNACDDGDHDKIKQVRFCTCCGQILEEVEI